VNINGLVVEEVDVYMHQVQLEQVELEVVEMDHLKQHRPHRKVCQEL